MGVDEPVENDASRMPAKISDAERQAIVDLLPSGMSAAKIAKQVGRSIQTVSRIAQAEGHRWGDTNLAHAHEARSAYSAERRAEIAARFTEECDRLLDELHGEYLVFNFGGKDNTFEERTLVEPPTEAKRQLIQAAREAMRTVLDIDRHDNKGDTVGSAFDAFLERMMGGE